MDPRLEAALAAQRPYELLEVLAVPIDTGLPQFLLWLNDSVA
ncbi:MAG: divalent cation tolerance protein CutA [Gammaproteobacteria bacterium]|nr:divalent cation tolerance protein CutA [Gammaproteobacteria bacterium]